jgi:hypothetical protein
MKLKNILFIIISASFLLLFGCNDDILDKEHKSAFTEDDVFGDVYLTQLYVWDTYNVLGFRGLDNIDRASRRVMIAALCDEGFWLFNYGTWDWLRGETTPDDYLSRFPIWQQMYTPIRKVNMFFEKIEQLEGDQEKINQMKGEMKYLRAWAYARLINFYGGVPLITETFSLDDEFEKDRDSYQDIVDFIIRELDEATELVPASVSDNDWGRVTKGACRALKGRQLLYAASKLHDPGTEPSGPLFDYNGNNKWQEASNAAKAVIDMNQYSLQVVNTVQDYQNIFINKNSEIIHGRSEHSEYGSVGTRVDINSPNGLGGNSCNTLTLNLVNDFEMANGKKIWEEDSGYDPSVDHIYDNRDLRFYATVVYNGSTFRGKEVEFWLPGGLSSMDGPEGWNYTKTGHTLRKFLDESINPKAQLGTQPIIYFRLAEFYLNYAEAQYHLGNESVAREYLNIIRKRVNMPEKKSTGQELLDDIRHERRIELCFENGHRFFDVRRWMIADSTENKNVLGREFKYVDANGKLDKNGKMIYNDIVVQKRAFHQRNYYLPIPRPEIEKSGIEQNSGYN